MSIYKKPLLRVILQDPKTKKSKGSFTVYKNEVKTAAQAIRKIRNSLR